MQTVEKNTTAAPDKSGRSWSIGQVIVMGLIALVVIFLIIGTLNDASTPEQAFSVAPQQPFVALALLAFVGGLLSFLAPCTLPILPAYFAFASQSGRKQIALNTLLFMLGVATMFSLFGASASALGSALRQNQDLILLFGGSLVVIFGVMSLLGKGFTGVQQSDEHIERRGLGGSFIFGLTFAIGWSTCIGPILGIMLTMAAAAGSVLRGTMLLFIYAIGLGLPLVLVSTFIGRSSRQSWIWRILRGKGWFINIPSVVIALIWAAAAWLILSAAVVYAFNNFDSLAGQTFTAVHSIALLALSIMGALLWVFTSEGAKTVELHLHSTQLISGLLFLAMGYLMLNGQLARITSTFAAAQPAWLYDLEDGLFNLFQ